MQIASYLVNTQKDGPVSELQENYADCIYQETKPTFTF